MAQRFEDLRAPELAERVTEASVLVLPIGAVEQHGPHLPLSVDLVIADEAARAAADRVGAAADVWLLPTLAVSKSTEHAWSPGTLWLSAETLLRVLDDLGACVATTAARRLVFVNGHGGNTTLLNVACRELRRRHGLLTFLVHPFVPPAYGGVSTEAEAGMGIHGGLEETSVMLHMRPDLVDMSKAVRNVPEWLTEQRHVRFGGSVQFGWLTSDFGPDGHVGDPTGATAERGRELFGRAVDLVAEQLVEIAGFDFRPR